MSVDASNPESSGGWSKRKLRIALLCSLAFNLLCIGLIAGAIFFGPRHHSRGEFGLRAFSHKLPDERRQVIRGTFKSYKPRFRELRREARTARYEAADVLAADPLDKDKLRASLARIDAAESGIRAHVSDFFIDVAGKLTPQERADLAKWWKKRHRRKFRHHKKPKADAASKSEAAPAQTGQEGPASGN